MIVHGSIETHTKVGNLEVLTSAIVHIDGDQQVVVKIANLDFNFKFINDGGEAKFQGVPGTNGDELTINLYNHGNSLGEGMLTPRRVGNVAGRALLFTYYLSTVDASKGMRRFEYVFYLGDAS